MKRLALTLVVAIAAAGLAALPAGARPNTFSFVQVVEKEFTLTPSRSSVRAGSVSLELVNFGMDTHDLVVQSTKPGSKPLKFKQLDPKGRTERSWGARLWNNGRTSRCCRMVLDTSSSDCQASAFMLEPA